MSLTALKLEIENDINRIEKYLHAEPKAVAAVLRKMFAYFHTHEPAKQPAQIPNPPVDGPVAAEPAPLPAVGQH